MALAPIPQHNRSTLTEGMTPSVHISYQVTIVANLMAFGRSAANIKRFGINTPHWRVLGCIQQVGPATAADIVRLVLQDKGSVSRAIAGLEKKGLIARLTNPAHATSPYIWMTEKGQALVDRIWPVFCEQAELFTNSLTGKEQKELCRLLDKLYEHAEKVRVQHGL